MDIKELLKLDVGNLAKIQRDHLIKEVENRLKDFIKHLYNNEFAEAQDMLGFSPSGDGYGCENYYLDFSDLEFNGIEDLYGVVKEIENLSSVIK